MFEIFKKKENVRDITIYLVDDDPDMINFLKLHLEKKWDFDVETFDCVKKVEDAITNTQVLPNLIISDIKLPEKSGLHLHHFAKNVPIIFITALGGDDIEDENYTIIGKPIDKAHLDELIREKLKIA